MNAKEADRLRMLAHEDQLLAESRELVRSRFWCDRWVGRVGVVLITLAMACNRMRKERRR